MISANLLYLVQYFQVDQFKGKLWGETRGKLWKLFEDPNSSFAAKVSDDIIKEFHWGICAHCATNPLHL